MNKKQLQLVTFEQKDERFMDIIGYEGSYLISDKGNVFSIKSDKFIKPRISDGYLRIVLCKNGKSKSEFIHKLIARAFIANPDNKPFINHINSKRNDNRIENLEWVTTSENVLHGWKYGNITGFAGKNHSVETKGKISRNKSGKKLSDGHKHKISIGLRRSDRAKKIIQYDLSMIEICRYSSIKDASEKLSISYDGIINNLRCLTKNYNSYVFRYE